MTGETRYDVFLSHNSADKPAVESLARRLVEEGLQPWLDTWNLIPGEPWQEAIEEALERCAGCAVFIGPSGAGSWQNEEMRAAIDRRVGESQGRFRVIPVLLPGAERGERSRLPTFLVATTWVEFRRSLDDEDAFHRLVCGIRGVEPGPGPGQAVYEDECPYRGLQFFDVEHTPFFFGREALTEWLLNELHPSTGSGPDGDNRFLAIIGPSGSGKSSLARAGLVAALKRGEVEGSDKWPIVICRPGPDPLESLAVALSSYTEDVLALRDKLREDERRLHVTARVALRDAPLERRLVVLVDQFEEVFTLCHDEGLRQALIDNLLYTSSVAGGQALVLLTMRADFYGKCAVYPTLAAALSDHQLLVGPMTEDELRRAIERPAQLAGCEFEPGLVDTLLRDVLDEPGGLPLLQHALLELWGRRAGRRLTHAAYQAVGGVEGALEQRAEAVYSQLSVPEQEICQRVFLRLTQPGEGTEDTKRRASLREMLPAEDKQETVEAVVQTLAGPDARLVTIKTGEVLKGERFVEVAHEALIRGWMRLREWIEEDREALRIHRRLTEAANEWQDSGRDEGFLYHHGARLAQAEEWAQAYGDDLNSLEREFLETSIEAREARRIAARRQVQGIIAALVVALVIAGLAFFAFRQSQIAQRKTIEVQSLALADSALRALGDHNTDLAIALALEANRIDQPPAHALQALAEAAYAPGTRHRFLGHRDAIRSVAFSPDGRTALSGSQDASLILWDLASGQLIRRFTGHGDWVYEVAFSPDGRRALSCSHDRSIILWDVETGQEIRRILGTDWVYGIAFGPEGRTALSGSEDGIVILWDLEQGEEIRRFEHPDSVNGLDVSPDGRLALVGLSDNSIHLWDIEKGEEIRDFIGHDGGVWDVAFSPDGRRALSGSWDSTMILWDVESGQEMHRFFGHSGWVIDVAFSPDGRTAVSSSNDGSLRLWDLESGQEIQRFLGHSAPVVAVAFSPNGRTVLSGSGNPDCSLRLWDLENGATVRHLVGHEQAVNSVAFSSDGWRALSGSEDQSLVLWDLESGQEIRRFEGHELGVLSVAFSPDGQAALSGSTDYHLIQWDLETGEITNDYSEVAEMVTSITFSPDGRIALFGLASGTLIVWDIEGSQQICTFEADAGWIMSSAFSPDGRTILSGSREGDLILWDLESKEEIRRFVGHSDSVNSVAFSPDGETALSGSEDRILILWDLESGEKIRHFLGHTQAVNSIAFSPDGRTALSGSKDNTVILWDVESSEGLFRFFGHSDQVTSVGFSPDGRRALSGSADGSLILWETGRDTDLEALRAWADANRYVRELTCVEREQYRVEPLCDEVSATPTPDLVAEAEGLAQEGKIEEAIAAYAEAENQDPPLYIPPGSWNALCWLGSLEGYAEDVMDACERAVELAPDRGDYRDSRGLARALSGDSAGAIQDFQAFVVWAGGLDRPVYQEMRLAREAWIAELQAGRNPFDAATLEALRSE